MKVKFDRFEYAFINFLQQLGTVGEGEVIYKNTIYDLKVAKGRDGILDAFYKLKDNLSSEIVYD